MKRLLAVTYLQGVFASALTEDMTDYATEEITEILRRNHKLKTSDDDDFTIRTQQELSTMLNSTTDLMTTLLACIAGISLVVGGIGIMNIMYVSVTERTREIGLAYVRRSTRRRYSEPISYRSDHDQYHRRYHRSHYRLRSQLDSEKRGPLAYLYSAVERFPFFRCLYRHRSLLRLVSCKKSCRFRSD